MNNSCCRMMNPGEPGKHGSGGINAYPNPTHNTITIEVHEALINGGELTLTDLMGNVVWKKKMENGKDQMDIDISTLAKGVYFVKGISEKDGEVYSNKIVLE